MIKFALYRKIQDPFGRRVPIEELFQRIDRGETIKVYEYYQVYINKETGERYTHTLRSPDFEFLDDKESIESFIYGPDKRKGGKYNRVIVFLEKEWIRELETTKAMISQTRINVMKSKGLIVEETSDYYTEIYDKF
jgi:hypothetical protein